MIYYEDSFIIERLLLIGLKIRVQIKKNFRMLRLIRPYGLNQLLTRHLSITAQQEKRIQFFLSDIGEGTKEVVIKG